MGFIDNSNICSENPFEDGLHLNNDGNDELFLRYG